MSSHSSILFCLCGPSGVGKSTISRKLLKLDPKLILSVSATTRQPRAGEEEGIHYYFLSKDQFKEKIENSQFLEWAIYNDQYYGTPLSNYENAKEKGLDLLLDIDVQGAQKLRNLLGPLVEVIFVAPPSIEALRKRLDGRGSESPEVVQKRMTRAEVECELLANPALTDHKIINSNLEQAIDSIREIIMEERALK